MIKTDSVGIREALKELRYMSLSKRIRMHYEAYLKMKRDQRAADAYIRETAETEGRAAGMAAGMAAGKIEERALAVRHLKAYGMSEAEIVKALQISEQEVKKYL